MREKAWDKMVRKLDEDLPGKVKALLTNKLVLSILAGMIVGSVFGLSSLFIVNHSKEGEVMGLASSKKDEPAEQAIDHLDHQELPDLYVIQIGVFTEANNAQAVQDKLPIPSVIWKVDQLYYVLHSIHASEAAAKQMDAQLVEKDIEAYVKLWEQKAIEHHLDPEDQAWGEDFLAAWIESLDESTKNKTLPLEVWEGLLAKPVHGSVAKDIQADLRDLFPSLKTEEEPAYLLLKLLHVFLGHPK